ncbi:DUF1479 domain-containing protein [Fusarium mundagurra]|uniref:DUF1479 domain-containing protein n=1 Tax=Fusarium mundagurra TaxID=1567541 RepID=A0A8H5XW94_9HYPO|nr:DUF1479 domain-containing protein [Fusarium mundagurra]
MSFTETEQLELSQQLVLECDLLDQRFAALKKSRVNPENKQKMIESYERLVKFLRKEVDHIDKHGAALVPEIDFDDVWKNGGKLPDDFTKLVHERGCLILRNIISEEQAVSWETSLKDYTKRHPGVGGHPHHKPAAWNVFWAKAQMEMRTNPRVLEAMKCVSRLWHVSDPTIPIDLDSHVIYPDRIRIRYPSNDPGQFPLDPHMDSGAIERWEDEENRKNYAAIFEGNWQDWDACLLSMEKSSRMAVPFKHTNWRGNTTSAAKSKAVHGVYYAATIVSYWGFFPTVEGHPDLDIKRAIIGIPPVRPGDYVFWHCDLVHGVDPTNPGLVDSSVSYNACNPLTPYNIESLLTTREAFQKGDVPIDFTRGHGTCEREYDHEDCGAKIENILTKGGLRAMGLERLDAEEEGLTQGRKEVREMANKKLGL